MAEEKIPAQVAKTEEKSTIIHQETEKDQKSSQEIAETEEMKTIADEKADDQKTEKKEVNSEKTEEKTISPEDAAKLAEKRKIDAPMENSRPDKVAKMEETTKETAEMEVIAQGEAPEAEEEKLAVVDNNFDDLLEEFLPDSTAESDEEEMSIIRWSRAEEFFEKIEALPVYQCFRQALESGNSEVLRHALEPHRPFAGILMIFGVHYHKKEMRKEVVLTILKEYMMGDGSIDVVGFINKYNLGEDFPAVTTVQRGLLLVMCIFVVAGKYTDPVDIIVAEAFLDAYDAQLWGDEAFETLYRFLRCPDRTLQVVGLTFVTAFATLCTKRARPDLSAVLYKSRIVEIVGEMSSAVDEISDYMLTIQLCADALKASESSS